MRDVRVVVTGIIVVILIGLKAGLFNKKRQSWECRGGGFFWAAITDPPGVISAWGNFPLSMVGGIAPIPCHSFVQLFGLQFSENYILCNIQFVFRFLLVLIPTMAHTMHLIFCSVKRYKIHDLVCLQF